MDCRQFTENLTAYMDRELTRTAAEKLESHLDKCVECSAELHSLKEVALFVDTHLKELEPSSQIWDAVRVRISTIPVPSRFPGLLQLLPANRWLAGLAATLLLTVGIWGYLRQQESEYELERYMSQYIEGRESEEQVHRTGNRSPRSPHDEFSDNPFVTVSYDPSFSNPFRRTNQ